MPARHLPLPLRSVLPRVADAGFAAVELDTRQHLAGGEFGPSAVRELRKRLSEENVALAPLFFPARRSLGNAEFLDARIAALRQAMQLAYDLGPRIVVTRVGLLRGPQPGEEGEEPQLATEDQTLRDVLRELAAFGNHVGCTLAILPRGEAAEDLLRLLNEIQTGPVGVAFDPAAIYEAGDDPADAFQRLHRSIVAYRARDAVRVGSRRFEETVVGRGEIDWETQLALLGEIGFAGPVVVDRATATEPWDDCLAGRRYLKAVAGA